MRQKWLKFGILTECCAILFAVCLTVFGPGEFVQVSAEADTQQQSGEQQGTGTQQQSGEQQGTGTQQQSGEQQGTDTQQSSEEDGESGEQQDFIKWVDFNVSYEALSAAYEYDVDTYGQEVHVEWIPLLAYTAVRTGGEFSKDALSVMAETKEKLCAKETTMEELTADLKYYDYYLEAYDAVLHEYVGEYETKADSSGKADSETIVDTSKDAENEASKDAGGSKTTVTKYGLKVFSPIAKGFSYTDYDDFGSSRDYGYSRPHLGHDMMGLIGTPIIAVEGGTVEALGWNQYGGWRIGIRSDDSKRYYYYAHLRQDRPYAEGLKEGDRVQSGDVIGYMGHTGYSTEENVNNIDAVHLHFGIQLIFDESQKDGNGEIWIDCYDLTRFLSKNRSGVVRDDATKEWHRAE